MDNNSKPLDVSTKAFLTRRLSVNMIIPESIIESVVNHAYKKAIEATYTANTIEIAGIGKFVFNKTKATYLLDNIIKQQKEFTELLTSGNDIHKRTRSTLEYRLKVAEDMIAYLKPKVNEF